MFILRVLPSRKSLERIARFEDRPASSSYGGLSAAQKNASPWNSEMFFSIALQHIPAETDLRSSFDLDTRSVPVDRNNKDGSLAAPRASGSRLVELAFVKDSPMLL